MLSTVCLQQGKILHCYQLCLGSGFKATPVGWWKENLLHYVFLEGMHAFALACHFRNLVSHFD